MSVASAKKFLERMATDNDFRAKVEAAQDPLAKKALVKAAGYDFDVADISAVLPESMGGELSDQELEGVAGGSVRGGEVVLATITTAAIVGTVAAAAAAI